MMAPGGKSGRLMAMEGAAEMHFVIQWASPIS
jgi:hypothetical protein